MEKKLTADEAYELHIAMWSDMQKQLGDDPSYKERCRFKRKWCEEKFPGEVVTNDCFLCEYTEQHSVGCGECPIKWHGHCTGDVDYRHSTISEILALPERRIKNES